MKQAAWSIALVASLACGCDASTPPPGAESCQNIIDACHDVDPGTGEVHECHETAHDDATAEACDPIETACVAACEALANADAGTDHDGGDHDGGP